MQFAEIIMRALVIILMSICVARKAITILHGNVSEVEMLMASGELSEQYHLNVPEDNPANVLDETIIESRSKNSPLGISEREMSVTSVNCCPWSVVKDSLFGDNCTDAIRTSKEITAVFNESIKEEECNTYCKGKRRLIKESETKIDYCVQGNFTKFLMKMFDTFKYKRIVILYDFELIMIDVLNIILGILSEIPVIFFNLRDVMNVNMALLNIMDTEFYVHIFILCVKSFSRIIDQLTLGKKYIPKYLLIIDLSVSASGRSVLTHEGLNGITSLSYVRFLFPWSSGETEGILLHTHNPFHDSTASSIHMKIYDINKALEFGDLFPDRFDQFYGHHFHLASWGMDFPFIYKKEWETEAKGFCVRMLTEISKTLNFTFKIYDLPPDEQWGSFVNESWKGMIGEVYRGEKDFGINQMDIIESRYHAVDFSVPFWTGNSRFLIRNPEPPPRWNSIVFPFNWMTWSAVAFTIMTLMLTYLFFFKVLDLPGVEDVGWLFLEVVRTILGLDCACFTNNISTILLFGSWRLVAMVIAISYKGNLVAYISVPPSPVRLKTLEQLASSSFTLIMTDYGSYLPLVLRSSMDPTLKMLGERLQIIPFDNELAFTMVKDGSYAFLEESSFLYSLVVTHKVSNVYYLPESLNQVYMGWYFPKDTPWKQKFDNYISSFNEFGLIDYWFEAEKKTFEKEMNYKNLATQKRNTIRPLGIEDLQGAFVVYGIGIGVATLVVIQEIFWIRITSLIQA